VTALVGNGRLRGSASRLLPIVPSSILRSRCGSVPEHCEYATVSPYDTEGPGPTALKVVRAEIKRAETNKTVREVVEAMDALDVVFAGISIVDRASVDPVFRKHVSVTGLLQNVISPEDLAKQGAVGTFSYCPFDENGSRDDRWRFSLMAGHYSKDWGIDLYKRMVPNPRKQRGRMFQVRGFERSQHSFATVLLQVDTQSPC